MVYPTPRQQVGFATRLQSFCSLMGLILGEFAFNGCIVGFSAQEPQVGKRPDDKEVIKWM